METDPAVADLRVTAKALLREIGLAEQHLAALQAEEAVASDAAAAVTHNNATLRADATALLRAVSRASFRSSTDAARLEAQRAQIDEASRELSQTMLTEGLLLQLVQN